MVPTTQHLPKVASRANRLLTYDEQSSSFRPDGLRLSRPARPVEGSAESSTITARNAALPASIITSLTMIATCTEQILDKKDVSDQRSV